VLLADEERTPVSDGVLVTFEVEFKPGVGEGFAASIPEDLKATRGFAGCRSVTPYRNRNAPDRFLFVEHWDSEAAYQAYFRWRQETGAFDQLADVVATPPASNLWDVLAEG
jgi:quinol monooxygenase YgiN